MTATISSIVIDCADPVALAGFYAKATGGQLAESDADFATVTGGPVQLAFQRLDGYQGPGWPNGGKHLHLDLTVPDVEAAKRELAALGATVPDEQPGGDDWTVLLDPEGHPFCVMPG
ncbi:MAG: VOC family protein [Nonomuraea sp.]|nr:VOC family protein [Streptomyces sp.]NUP65714.1 VOC family protein [Nonomuraea sp.]NUP82162.1 VOC family protein [Nonomuraea sp.]NUS08959.1 VOC family protein [Nonomuraea sp.]